MSFNIQNFRSSLALDGARPNLFEVSMSTINVGVANIDPEMKFKCRAAQLPEDNIGVIPVNYFGREIKIPGNRTFPEWTVTVINDEDFLIRNSLEQWMSGINSHVRNLRNSNYVANAGERGKTYTCDATVTQFAKNGDPIKKYTFVGCWPTNVSAIDLDWGSNDQLEEFQITFAYQWWESVPYTDTSGTGAPASSISPGGAALTSFGRR